MESAPRREGARSGDPARHHGNLPEARFRQDGGGGKRLNARISQLSWILDHIGDLMADFRAFYHLGWKEALALPAPEFFILAYRCSAYQGVMATRVMRQEEGKYRNVKRADAKMVESEKSHILADPLLRDVIDFG